MGKYLIWIGYLLLVSALGVPLLLADQVVTIEMSQTSKGRVYFDPVGILIPPGTTVRWIQRSGYHTVTAYHPENGNRELRIPYGAEPWDSGILKGIYPQADAVLEHTFQLAGVYDYYCDPHERAGMVGRIIVGSQDDQPMAKPLGYGAKKGNRRMPKAVVYVLPTVERIMKEQIVSIHGDGRSKEK